MDNIQKSLLKNKNWHEIVINKNFSSQSKKMDILSQRDSRGGIS